MATASGRYNRRKPERKPERKLAGIAGIAQGRHRAIVGVSCRSGERRSDVPCRARRAQARPSVSNIVEVNASRASLPAQTTNWKA